jgi:sigma-B regulation protein RsbU (phosphoserine phosphatase)
VRSRLSRELSVASQLQSRLLPGRVPTDSRFEIAAWTKPHRELGGDLYDLIPMDAGNLGIAIGDATGKSIPAAMVMAAARGGLRACVDRTAGPREVIDRLNRTMWAITRGDLFMSFLYGIFEPATGRFAYACAGHPAPLLFRGTEVRELESSGLVLGVTPHAQYDERSVSLESGDVLVLYTDGITESMDQEREWFAVDRVIENIRGRLDESASAILEALRDAVVAHSNRGPYQDDMTLLVLKVR